MRVTNTILLTLMLVLTGCTDMIAERTGAEVVVVPVETAYRFHSTSTDNDQLRHRINELLDTHFATIRKEGITLKSSTSSGGKLARSIKSHLIEKGVETSKIVLSEDHSKGETFDLTVYVTQFKVVTHRCDYSRVGQYHSSDIGCSIENSRWHSLVNPQTALSKTANSK